MRDTKTALYRHFDANDDLLYVGISHHPTGRTSQHKQHAEWYYLIAKTTVQWFPCRELAHEAEREAIAIERPAYNVSHNIHRKDPTRKDWGIPDFVQRHMDCTKVLEDEKLCARVDKVRETFKVEDDFCSLNHRFWLRLTDREFYDVAEYEFALTVELMHGMFSGAEMTKEEFDEESAWAEDSIMMVWEILYLKWADNRWSLKR